MDFSILYRVLWKPNEVFKQFVGKTRLEPFILIIVIVVLAGVNAYVGHFEEIVKQPALLIMGLIQGFLLSLLFPIVNATIAFLIISFLSKEQYSFLSLVSAFILGGLPIYIEAILIAAFGYHSIGLDSLISFILPSIEKTQPFLFGMIATITPFLAWVVILWWVAINQLFNLRRWQNALVVGSVVLFNMLLSGIWRSLISMLSK